MFLPVACGTPCTIIEVATYWHAIRMEVAQRVLQLTELPAVFDKPTKDDVVRSISMVTANACQVAADECRRLEKTCSPRFRSDLPRLLSEHLSELHSRWLTEAMDVLAGFLGKVEASPKDMTDWVRPLVVAMSDTIVKLLLNYFALDGGAVIKELRPIVARRVDHALREFELGRIDGRPIEVDEMSASSEVRSNGPEYVSVERLQSLRAIKSSDFDLRKLIRLCEELNFNYSTGNYYSVAMLVRAIMDHVPPIFSATTFEGLRANHGGRSFKEHMAHLDKSHRKMADDFLHGHVRRREVLPTETSIHFAPALDALLGEVEAKLR